MYLEKISPESLSKSFDILLYYYRLVLISVPIIVDCMVDGTVSLGYSFWSLILGGHKVTKDVLDDFKLHCICEGIPTCCPVYQCLAMSPGCAKTENIYQLSKKDKLTVTRVMKFSCVWCGHSPFNILFNMCTY